MDNYSLPVTDVDSHPDRQMPDTEHKEGTPLGWGPSQELPMSMNPDKPGNVAISDRARMQRAVKDSKGVRNDGKFPGY